MTHASEARWRKYLEGRSCRGSTYEADDMPHPRTRGDSGQESSRFEHSDLHRASMGEAHWI